MTRLWTYLLELVGLAGIVGMVAYLSWTKMALGAALSILGAFFPHPPRQSEPERGEGSVRMKGVQVAIKGGVRFAVVVAGIVLIIGAVADGHVRYQEQLTARRAAANHEADFAILQRDHLDFMARLNKLRSNQPATNAPKAELDKYRASLWDFAELEIRKTQAAMTNPPATPEGNREREHILAILEEEVLRLRSDRATNLATPAPVDPKATRR